VPQLRHSAKKFYFFFKKTSSPSAWAVALGKEICFFLKKPSSPSAAAQALVEACFLIFFKKKMSIMAYY